MNRIARTSLLWKLILAFMLVAILSAALVAIFIRITSANRLSALIVDQQRSSLQEALSTYYGLNGSWANAEKDWFELQFLARPNQFPTPQPGDPASPFNYVPAQRSDGPDRSQTYDRRRLFGLADSAGIVVVSVDPQYPVGALLSQDILDGGAPVTYNDQHVGTILTAHLEPRLNPEENLFLQRLNEALMMATGAALLTALLVGFILARTLIRPLQALTGAAQKIAEGQLEQQVQVTSKDEIGRLAAAFNRMSQEVARGNHLRKQMTADIAHDLRTPLTVIAGYVEAMRDGVLKPTPERLSLIYTEIERLQDLVGDLKMLSQVDAGELPLHPQAIEPLSLLDHAQAPFQHRAATQQVNLCVQAEPGLPAILIDEARMMQVFGNLITNALRYTPPGGEICLQARTAGSHVILAVRDTGSGIDPDELPFVFDRFHRADKSRHTDQGESGLGLAIVKALVEAHGGHVRVESTLDVGTTISIELPLAADAARQEIPHPA
jgi:signal transduction histidine kinase